MAKIILNVELNSSKALTGIDQLNTKLSNLGSKQNTSSGFSATEKSLNNLTKRYNDFLLQIRKTESMYPKGTFDSLKKEVEANVTAINKLTTGTEGYAEKAKELDTQLSAQQAQFAQLRQATKQNTDAVVKHGDSIASLAKKFVLWQAAATLVMQPIQMLRSAIASVNETLTETENRVIELQRVLKEGETTAMQASDELYGLAEQYGQTFENSSQIAVNFARSGMDWQDTLKATESALLALNVAELDSEEATNGLIAIMSQFKLSASDLETVVDKLNKTADNFPVTTEKLLKALQRTGSSARNANLSLDETIGLITSLSQATGRSGENLGTAINSLISYSQKAKSLDIFAQLSEETAQAVDNFRHGAGTILNVWESVSKVIETADSRQKELLNGLTENEDIKNLDTELQDELGDIFEEVNDVYGTANTFRKSYFISLLNNINTVRDAQKVASDAEGYSQKENEKYMETYTAKVNTLKATWEEMVTDEQGFLGFKKGLVEFATSLVKIIDNLGGIKNLVLLIGVVLVKSFNVKIFSGIISFFANFTTNLKNAITGLKNLGSNLIHITGNFKAYQEALAEVKKTQVELEQAQEKLTEAQETHIGVTEAEETVKAAETKAEEANATAKSASAAVTSALSSAISILILAYMAYSAIQRKHTENLRKQTEIAEKELESVKDLQETFNKLEDDLKNNNITFDEAKKIVNDNASEMKKLGIEVDTTAGSYEKLKTAVENANKKLVEKAYAKAIGAEAAAAAELENEADNNGGAGQMRKNIVGQSAFLNVYGEFSDEIKNYGTEIENAAKKIVSAKVYGKSFISGSENILAYYDDLLALKEKLEEKAKTDDTILDDDLYKDVSEEIANLYEQVEKYRTALEQKASAEVADWLTTNDVKNAEDYNKLVKQISDGTGDWSGYSETYRKYIKDVVEQYFPQFASQTKEVAKGHKEILVDLSEVSSKYEDISNALKKILDDEQDAEQLASYNEKIKEAQLDVEKAREKVADAIKEKEQAQKDLAKKQLELKKAIAKAQAEYINKQLDEYISSLDVANDKEEKLKAIEEARADLAEKQLELEKEREKLERLKEQRTVKQFNQSTNSFEFVADEKQVQDQIDAIEKAEEDVKNATDKVADAQNNLNDWLKNQAIKEVKAYIENGGRSEKKINSILNKWLGESGSGKLSNELKDWRNSVNSTISKASKKATTENKAIKDSIKSAKDAVKSAKETLKKKEQDIVNANKDVKEAIKNVDKTKVDKETYLKTQAINAVTTLLSDGKTHSSKEVQSLIGSYGLSSATESKIWNTIVKAGGFNPSAKGTRRHWKSANDAQADGFNVLSKSAFDTAKKSGNAKIQKGLENYNNYQAYLDAMYTNYKGGSNVYDKGGILHGLGGIKATNQPETVLDPTLTKKILEPSSNANFVKFAKSLGVLFGASDNIARASYTTNSGNTTNTDNRNYTINGVPFTQEQVNTHTLGELLQTAAFLRD